MRILLSEGSGLTSRQVASRLGDLGHEVEILSSSRICLSRFTRHVRRVHLVPPFGRAPFAWLDAARAVAQARHIDLLLPTQEQVTLLSAMQATLGVSTVVPDFESLCRVQDKLSASRTLRELGIPQPAFIIANTQTDLARVTRFPVFVKRPISTASTGVRLAAGRADLESAAKLLGLGSNEILVQSGASGPLAMVQAVADGGRLIAAHACLRVREGIGGGASIKESIDLPGMQALLSTLCQGLRWHGPLSMDVILGADGPLVIDINPRLVEPMNAYLSGVDLVGAVLDLAGRRHPPVQPPGRTGIRSQQLLLAILRAAEKQGTRVAVVRELARALRHKGDYAEAVEELTPLAGDLMAAMPVIAALLATLAWPPLWHSFQSGAVDTYSLTPEAWRDILAGRDGHSEPPARPMAA